MKNKVASRRISNVLQQIKLLKDKYDELAAVTGEHFNVFSILRIKRKEVITHTPMLAELLNPHGSHHQGVAFLKLFLETCIKQQEHAIHNNPETFRVRSEERTDQGQFDILLEKEKEACIVIENKIDAEDQVSQLNRYYQDAGERFSDNQIKLIYLTLDGSTPDEKSLKAVNGQGRDLSVDDVIRISYREDIIHWLEECMKLQEVQRISSIREIVFQYRDLLKQLTGQSTNKGFSMKLKNILAQNKNYELIPYIEQAILEFKVHVQLNFWEELARIMPDKVDNSSIHDNKEKEALEDKIRHCYQGSRNRFYYGTTFKLNSFSWEQTEIALRVEIDSEGWIYYGFILFDKDGNRIESCDDKRFDTLAVKLSDNDFERTKWYLGWKYPATDIGFLEYLASITNNLLDDSNRTEFVQEFVTEIADAVNQLKENLE